MASNSTGIERSLHPLGRGLSVSYLPPLRIHSNSMPSTHGMFACRWTTTKKCTSTTQRRDTAQAAGRTSCSRRTLACHQSPRTTTQSWRPRISLKCSSKVYQLVQPRNKTIETCCVHSPVCLPSTQRRGKTGGRLNEWRTTLEGGSSIKFECE